MCCRPISAKLAELFPFGIGLVNFFVGHVRLDEEKAIEGVSNRRDILAADHLLIAERRIVGVDERLKENHWKPLSCSSRTLHRSAWRFRDVKFFLPTLY